MVQDMLKIVSLGSLSKEQGLDWCPANSSKRSQYWDEIQNTKLQTKRRNLDLQFFGLYSCKSQFTSNSNKKSSRLSSSVQQENFLSTLVS